MIIIDELIPKLRDVRQKNGNVKINIYDVNTGIKYPIQSIETTELEIDFVIDTATDLEKRIYRVIDREEIEKIEQIDFSVIVTLKNGDIREFTI